MSEWATIVHVKRHFGVCEMTISRWVKNEGLGFPRPTYINGRRYWRLQDVEEWAAKRYQDVTFDADKGAESGRNKGV